MIDLDGQCNLTTWWVPEAYAADMEVGGPDHAEGGADIQIGDTDGEESSREEDEAEEPDADAAGVPPASPGMVWQVRVVSTGLWLLAAASVQPLGPALVLLEVSSAAVLPQYERHPKAEHFNVPLPRVDNLPNGIEPILQSATEGLDAFYRTPLQLFECTIPGSSKEKGGELWLLPGSRRVIKLEYKLNHASHPDNSVFLATTLLAFRAVMNKMFEEKNLDYIFVDCSPSSSILNKASDALPTTPRLTY